MWREEKLGTRLRFTPMAPYAAAGEPTSRVRRRITTRLQSFLCLVTSDMLESIREATVAHGQMEKPEWFIALSELMAFIAVIILRGVIKLPAVPDYWSGTLGHKQITDIMPRDRFVDIMRHLRFDDKSTRSERVKTDRFAAISELWGAFACNCITSYTPGRHITVDEQLFPTKTRCPFLQYIASKPDKFGIKFWVACDLQTKYICNVMPYLGKDPSRPTGERLAENVVMRLVEPFLDKGRNIATDNFFTSLKLAQRLETRKTTILGTISKIRRELPPSARETERQLFATQVYSTTGATLTVYQAKAKKAVNLLSTMHIMVDTESTGKKKPSTVLQYNTAKCGVDIVDHMVREYTVRKGTRRWPVAVFYNMIDMAALNAHVLYQACTGTKERRVDFLAELAMELAHSYVAGKKALREELLRKEPATPSPGKRSVCQIKHRCKENRTIKRCAGCYKYTCGQCIKQRPWTCHFCD
ncbi:piggyBac transposable element-derived protein 4-like [Betta splendens]|uniref:PiggyBac transposable element-derived protein 4-like n=1 Tax=Betta splendens TaxID=158456 RepID=A0A9W2XU09_BETSP|nr:piggyBac transposable element-derived protein 4-like [Betta splendens]